MHLIILSALLIQDRSKPSVFIRMQDNSNLRSGLPKNTSAKGKCIYQNLIQSPKNKTYAKKRHYTINFIHLINKACRILSTFINQCTGSVFTVSAFIFLTLTPTMPIPFTAIPQHITVSPIHCNGHTAHLKTHHSHFW